MRDFPELPPDGGIDLRVIVAVEVGPNRGIRVKIFASVNVPQHRAPACGDDHWLAFQPVTHLRKRMPDELMVEFRELAHLIYD